MQLILMWLGRRALELGGLAGVLLAFWQGLPPGTQSAVVALLSSKWDTVTLGALAPLVMAIGGYVWSFVATTRAQVVVGGKKVAVKDLPPFTKTLVEDAVATKPKPLDLIEALSGIFRR